SITSEEPGMSVSAPATRPPVQDSAVAIVSLRIRHRSSSERERARASLPLILLAPGQTNGGACGRGDAFLAAGEAKPLAGRCLDGDPRDIEPGDLGDAGAHGIAQRPDLRAFADHRDFEIGDPAATRGDAIDGIFEELVGRGGLHCGSLGGKCEPMSPSASAPRMASTRACRPTSPSEWARKPLVCGTRTPQIITWSPSPKACTSSQCTVVHTTRGEV